MSGIAYSVLFTRALEEADRLKFFGDLDRRFGWTKGTEISVGAHVVHFGLGEEYPGESIELESAVKGLGFRPSGSLSFAVWTSDQEAQDLARSLAFEYLDYLEGDAVVRTKAQIAPVTELEMMFEEPRPYVEIPRLWPVRGDPG